MSFSKKRQSIIFFATAFIFMSTYVYFNVPSYAGYTLEKQKCEQNAEDLANLVNLTYRVHSVLKAFSLDHWLMYGSILGAKRYQGPLPWDYDVDLAVKGEQFSQINFDNFVATCNRQGITVRDKRFRKGILAFFDKKTSLYVDLFIYYEYNFGMAWRSGLDGWLFFLHYRLHHSFPVRLVTAPMPEVRFGFFEIAVPKENNEVLKYLYRINWWKEVRPLGC